MKKWMIGLLVGAMLLGIAGAAYAEGVFHPRGPRGERGAGILGDYMPAALAEALGIDLDTLRQAHDNAERGQLPAALGLTDEAFRAALDEARSAALAAALADGAITEEQAQALAERNSRFGEARGAGPLHDEMQAAVAEVLGISIADLEAYRSAGTRFPEILEDLGLDPDTVREALEAARAEVIAEALADGTISQETADQMLEHSGKMRRAGGQHGPGGADRLPRPGAGQ